MFLSGVPLQGAVVPVHRASIFTVREGWVCVYPGLGYVLLNFLERDGDVHEDLFAEVLQVLVEMFDLLAVLVHHIFELLIGEVIDDVLVVVLDVHNITRDCCLHLFDLVQSARFQLGDLLLVFHQVAQQFPALLLEFLTEAVEVLLNELLLFEERLLADISPVPDGRLAVFESQSESFDDCPELIELLLLFCLD